MKEPDRFNRSRVRLDHWFQRFFASSAGLTIVVLGLITFFLFQEGAGFFPQNLRELRVYRLAGLEYLDLMRAQLEGHAVLSRRLQTARLRQIQTRMEAGKTQEEIDAALAPLNAYAERFDATVDPLRGLVSDWSDLAVELKEKANLREDALQARQFLLKEGKRAEADAVAIPEIDFAAEFAPVLSALPEYQQAAKTLRMSLSRLLDELDDVAPLLSQKEVAAFQKAARVYLQTFAETEHKLLTWQQNVPVPWHRTLSSFLFGKQWITNSFWQDWYGILPLLTGSLLVAIIAVAIAMPLGLCAAVYVGELARPAEARFIKPALEFIAAIPSVVLGFFGIAVLGEGIRLLSRLEALSWVPGFPIAERLNAFTAGCLLALMAIPTIFTLTEDALNSVPKAFKEASFALGATRLQTVLRVLVPSASSGIVSAVLLGFGRVIGETMVVLLCAGNRIAIPDFTHGLGTLFEPVHTMTGIIAQELGEVPNGTIQYRALFMVGLFLFFITLLLNGFVQYYVRRRKIAEN